MVLTALIVNNQTQTIMKSIKFLAWGMTAVLTISLVVSCSKSNKDPQPQFSDLNNSSLVQVFIATVNASRNVVLIDGKRVSRPTLASGLSFPTSVYPSTNTGYAFAVPGGLRAFLIQDTLAATTQKPLAFSANMEVGKNYTVFMYDTITSPKQLTVETPIEIPADGSARIRFANFIYDANAVPAVDVFSTRRNQTLFTNINRTEVTSFIPTPSVLNDTLIVRETGTVNELTRVTGFNPAKQRSYTLVYRGSYRGTRAATILANH